MRNLGREVIRCMPADIPAFARDYFAAIDEGRLESFLRTQYSRIHVSRHSGIGPSPLALRPVPVSARVQASASPASSPAAVDLRVCVFGLRGTGVEAAKSLMLAGVSSLTVHDDSILQERDLGSIFCAERKAIGKPRSEAVRGLLTSVNSLTLLKVHTGPITQDYLRKFDVAVFTDLDKQWTPQKLVEFDSFCAQNGVRFVWASALGLYATAFSDFGPDHKVSDMDGIQRTAVPARTLARAAFPYKSIKQFLAEKSPKYIELDRMDEADQREWACYLLRDLGVEVSLKELAGMTTAELVELADGMPGTRSGKAATRVVTVQPHGLHTGEWVRLDGLRDDEGKRVASVPARQITVDSKDPCTFYITAVDAGEMYGDCAAGACAVPVKVSTPILHKRMGDALDDPAQIDAGNSKTRAMQIGLIAVFRFYDANQRYPVVGSREDIDALWKLAGSETEARGLHLQDARDNTAVVERFWTCASTQTAATAAIAGGLAAIEAAKAKGVLNPLSQWLSISALDAMGEDPPASPVVQSQYADYATLLGPDALRRAARFRCLVDVTQPTGFEIAKSLSLTSIGSIATCGRSDSRYRIAGQLESINLRSLTAEDWMAFDILLTGTRDGKCERVGPISLPWKCEELCKPLIAADALAQGSFGFVSVGVPAPGGSIVRPVKAKLAGVRNTTTLGRINTAGLAGLLGGLATLEVYRALQGRTLDKGCVGIDITQMAISRVAVATTGQANDQRANRVMIQDDADWGQFIELKSKDLTFEGLEKWLFRKECVRPTSVFALNGTDGKATLLYSTQGGAAARNAGVVAEYKSRAQTVKGQDCALLRVEVSAGSAGSDGDEQDPSTISPWLRRLLPQSFSLAPLRVRLSS